MKYDSLKFIRLTDTDQVKFRIQPNLSEADKTRGMSHLSNFYLIAKGKHLLAVEDTGEVLLLNTKTKRIGVKAFTLPCKLKPDASPKRIRKAVRAFRRAYQCRN
ncbi:MAG: hypothetical protein OXG97_10190 [Candidatus Poribacteria bacterium]|nr:hypothetical protein [Candidatus Poribacteria bacterium]